MEGLLPFHPYVKAVAIHAAIDDFARQQGIRRDLEERPDADRLRDRQSHASSGRVADPPGHPDVYLAEQRIEIV